MMRALELLLGLCTLFLPMLAIGAFALGVAGRRDRTSPRCGHCRGPIGFRETVGQSPCPVCQSLVAECPPQAASKRPWWRAILTGLVCLGLALGAFGGMELIRLRPMSRPTTRASVRPAMQAQSHFASEIMELERAVDTGSLPRAVVREEVRRATATDAGGPAIAPSAAAMRVAAIALGDPGADQAYWDAVLAHCVPPPQPAALFLTTTAPDIHLDPTLEPHPDLPLARVAVITGITVDGTPLDLDALAGQPDRPLVPPVSIPRLAPGDHTIDVRFDVFLYERFDGQRIGLGSARLLPRVDWPRPLARGEATSRVQVTVGQRR